MAIFGNTPPSSPLPSTYAGFGPDIDDWACDTWKEYYIRNKAAFGKEKAQTILNRDIANTNSFSGHIQWCKYDCEWVKYFASEGLKTGNVFSESYCAGTAVVSAVEHTAETADNLTGSVSKLTSSKVLSLGLIAGAGYLALKVFYPEALKKIKK
jgi:hypothetical protein